MTCTKSKLGRLLYETGFMQPHLLPGREDQPWYAEIWNETNPENPIPKENMQFADAVGTKIDSGDDRDVWSHRTDPKLVIKTAVGKKVSVNKNEAAAWSRLKKDWDEYFAPVRAVSADGHFLVQDRADALSHGDFNHDDPVPRFMILLDDHAANFGRLPNGNLVMLDYSEAAGMSLDGNGKEIRWWLMGTVPFRKFDGLEPHAEYQNMLDTKT